MKMNYESMTKQQLIELLAEKDREILRLAQEEAQQRLSATLGWQRWDNARRLANGYMEEFARRGLAFEPKVSDKVKG